MKLCFIADARSPISQYWIRYFIEQEHEVHVISSYSYSGEELSGAFLYQVRLGLSGLSKIQHNGTIGKSEAKPPYWKILGSLRSGSLSAVASSIQNWLVPLDLYLHVRELNSIISGIGPTLVHAMRVPREGVAAAMAIPAATPLILSVWGNDFTLIAAQNMLRRRQTQQALKRADALHSDCYRDQRLAVSWGLNSNKPTIVLPGTGGINQKIFYPYAPDATLQRTYSIPKDAPVIINPRGFRPQCVQTSTYFQAISYVLSKHPNAIFISTGMRDNPTVNEWITRWKIPKKQLRLMSTVPHEQMGHLYRLARIMVSPSVHDGTPNSLLEAMACGAFPVAGRIESIEEWIDHNQNGLLCDPTNPIDLAEKISRAIEDKELRERAFKRNQELIKQRADYPVNMRQASDFYAKVLEQTRS